MNTPELVAAVTAGLTGVLVLITGFYAWVTYRMASVMQHQADEATRPYITVSVLAPPKDVRLFLRIANTGRTAAYNVRLTIDRDFFRYGKSDPTDNLASFSVFQREIQCFPPGAELTFALAQGFVLFAPEADPQRTPLVFNITASYSYSGKTRSETTAIDLNPYRSSNYPPDPTVDELEKVRKELEKIASSVGKLVPRVS